MGYPFLLGDTVIQHPISSVVNVIIIHLNSDTTNSTLIVGANIMTILVQSQLKWKVKINTTIRNYFAYNQ